MNLLHQLGNALGLRKVSETHDAPVALEETVRERMDLDAALHIIPPMQTPADLQLRLRVALSHERVRAQRRWSGRLAHQWHLLRENTLRPAGMRGAVIAAAVLLLVFVGGMLGALAPQQAVEANDIPLIGFSAPRYLYSTAGVARHLSSVDQSPLMIEAKINAQGRIYDYRVISGSVDNTTEAALRDRLLGGVFKPASFFGEPVRGTVVLTFADVDVHA